MKKYVLGTIIGFALIVGIGFATGTAELVYNKTIGKDVSSSRTEVFHKSKGYVDGMVQDLSKYKLELAQTKDETARVAIISHINEQFANYDENDIQSLDLKQFLIDCRNGNIK